MKLLWLPERMEDIYIHEALQSFGKIKAISAETWRVSDMEQMRTLNRDVVVSLADGVRVSDIPHLLTVCGLQSLLLIPGRPPLCLRCHRVGHIRQHCRTPRCEDCHRFGHSAECVVTYVGKLRNRTRPPDDALQDHIMDATEVLDATGDLPGAVVSDANAVDKASGSECTVAAISEDKAENADMTLHCVKATPTASEPMAREQDNLSRATAAETSKTEPPSAQPHLTARTADEHVCTEIPATKRPASGATRLRVKKVTQQAVLDSRVVGEHQSILESADARDQGDLELVRGRIRLRLPRQINACSNEAYLVVTMALSHQLIFATFNVCGLRSRQKQVQLRRLLFSRH